MPPPPRRPRRPRSRRPSTAALSLAVLLALTVAGSHGSPVGAKPIPEPPSTVPFAFPTTTQAPTPTTTQPPPQPVPTPIPPPIQPVAPAPEPTAAPAPDPAPDPAPETAIPTAPGDPPPTGDPPPAGDGSDLGPVVGAVPGPLPRLGDDTVALILDDRVRSGDSSTAALLEALRPLTALGFSEEEAFVAGMGRFPLAGLATYSDDFHDPRYNPTPHLHQGTDIWAAFGTPVRSPADGVVTFTDEVVGGKSAYVTVPDGTYYYLTHLGGFPNDLSSGDTVAQGRVVGYNGDSGNASGGPPHVHFEIRPGGGGAVNPKPILDQWVAEALAAASQQVSGNLAANPRIMLATGEIRRFDVPASATSERAAKGPLLWSASVTSGGAALRLAEVEAARMARRVDWSQKLVEAQATAVDRHRAEQRAVNLFSRLTPPGLRPVLDPTST